MSTSPTAMKHTHRSLLQSMLALLSVIAWAMPTRTHAVEVPTVPVQSASTRASFTLDGVVQPVKQSTVSAQASGRIASFVVKAGDTVRAGQVLATIDDRDTQVGLQRAQAQINQAEAELRNARSQMERMRDLQSQGFVSHAALDSATMQYQSAQAQREQAEAGARQSGIAQGHTRVTAPMDGWVLQTFAQAGDLAVPGTPLLVLYAPQPLRAVVQVPASRSQWVRQAKQTTVWVGDGAKPHSMVPLSRLEVPSSDPVSQTSEWRLDLPPKESAALLPGQQVRVNFVADDVVSMPRLRVPASAVVRRNELTAVYVVAGARFVLRSVRLGADLGSEGVEVLSGMRAGEWVATDTLRAAQPDALAQHK